MKTLYLDNYKGFKETFIPFYDVNFLVGENSTGKTAVLNLLNIMGEPSFWLSPDFNVDDVELGCFNEIVNQCSADKTYFRIGIEYKETKKKNASSYFLMNFKQKNRLPYLSEYMAVIADKTVLVTIHKSSVDYKTIDFNGEPFKDWVLKYLEFENIKKKHTIKQEAKNAPFFYIRQIVEMEVKGKSDTKPDYSSMITPIFNNRILWLAPIRAKAKRTYEVFKDSFSPEGDHTPNLLRKIISKKDKNPSMVKSLVDFGLESGLFDGLEIEEYGRMKGAPFAINVVYNSLPIKITNVGYGVSQVMPLVVEMLTSKGDVFAIQQPEVHLHPKAQATFGEFIYNSAVESKNRFLIETHSDYTINRFRLKMYENSENNKVSGQILFFERNTNGTTVSSIKLKDDGKYPDEMPARYGEFFIDEELKMLEI